MAKNILIYGFPVITVALEWILRKALQIESEVFIGPTLAAAGLGFLMPLIKPKDRDFGLSDSIKAQIKEKRISLIAKREEIFIDWVWLAIFVSLVSWMFSVYLSSKYPLKDWGPLKAFYYPGFFNYIIAIILSGTKERI